MPCNDARLIECAHCLLLVAVFPQVQLNTGGLQYIRLAQPVSGAQVVQGQIQTLTANAQQVWHRRDAYQVGSKVVSTRIAAFIYRFIVCGVWIIIIMFRISTDTLDRSDHFAVHLRYLSRTDIQGHDLYTFALSLGRCHRLKCNKGNSNSTSSLMVR